MYAKQCVNENGANNIIGRVNFNLHNFISNPAIINIDEINKMENGQFKGLKVMIELEIILMKPKRPT